MNEIFNKYQRLASDASLGNGTLKSKDWFRKLVSNEGEISSLRKVTDGLKTVSRLKPGMMVTYKYFPKHFDTLPYYDTHPLVIVTNITRDGWTGINIHYMHPRQRALLLFQHQRSNGKGNPFIDTEQGNYATKKYLSTFVSGQLKEIPANLWEIAIQLPFENFQKRTKFSVWNQTTRKVNKKKAKK